MSDKIRIVHYINQFFAQRGGEEAASTGVDFVEQPLGPGLGLLEAFGSDAEIAATIICGDNYINENMETASAEILGIVEKYKPDLFIAGPAYAAGRYGVACGTLCTAVEKALKIPVVTAMNEENPGVEIYRRQLYIISTGPNARTMSKDTASMANLARKLLKGEFPGFPEETGCFTRGFKHLVPSERSAAKRVVDMALDKYYNRSFATETPLPQHDAVPKAPKVPDLSRATVVLATDGGLFPAGNPDKMPPINPDKFRAYSITDHFVEGEWTVVHNGYDSSIVVQQPERLVPVDAFRALEKAGKIGKLHDEFLSTTGLMTTVANGQKIGRSMAKYVRDHNIDAVILTSTWGTSTRCGAVITKELERAGIPAVQVCNMTPVADAVGVNRMWVSASIKYPFGAPGLPVEEEKIERLKMVEEAIQGLAN